MYKYFYMLGAMVLGFTQMGASDSSELTLLAIPLTEFSINIQRTTLNSTRTNIFSTQITADQITQNKKKVVPLITFVLSITDTNIITTTDLVQIYSPVLSSSGDFVMQDLNNNQIALTVTSDRKSNGAKGTATFTDGSIVRQKKSSDLPILGETQTISVSAKKGELSGKPDGVYEILFLFTATSS